MIDEKIAGQRSDPGLEAALLQIEDSERFLKSLRKTSCGEIFGVGAGAGEAVADGVDAAVLGDDKLLPRLGVASDALANQLGEGFLCGFLFWGTLQRCLKRL